MDRRVFQSGHGCRLDVRARAVELACGVRLGVERAGGAVLGRDGPAAIGIDLPVRVDRTVGVFGALGIGRAVPVGRAVRDGRVLLTATGPIATDRPAMEDDLVASGRFVRIEARGERTGLVRPVTVGFVEDDADHPGSLLVAARSTETSWARNLLADPACHVRTRDRSFDAVADPLAPAEHARAIRELILRYGTPAESLGHGPSFRLRPAVEAAG